MSALSDAIMGNIVAKVGGQNDDARATRAAVDTYVKQSQAELASTITDSITEVGKALSQAKAGDTVDDDTVAALQAVMQYLPKILTG